LIVVVAVIAAAGLSPRLVATRLLVIAPFVLYAALIPFVATGEQIEVAGLALSVDGLWASWNVGAKATLGASISIVVAATTSLGDLVGGLGRLRLPAVLVAIVAFLFRYVDVLAEQVHRQRAAMTARAHDPRWLWQARPLASSAGVLFV